MIGYESEAHEWMDPQKIKKPSTLRKQYLCVNEEGRAASADDCRQCPLPCGYGMRYLELLGIPCPAKCESELGKLVSTPKVDIYDVLRYFNLQLKHESIIE